MLLALGISKREKQASSQRKKRKEKRYVKNDAKVQVKKKKLRPTYDFSMIKKAASKTKEGETKK